MRQGKAKQDAEMSGEGKGEERKSGMTGATRPSTLSPHKQAASALGTRCGDGGDSG